MGADIDEVRSAISAVVHEVFAGDQIDDVLVAQGRDSDGDQVLNVTVVADLGKGEVLDGRKIVGLVRHLRARLETLHTNDFPMVDFVSRSDFGKPLERV